MYICRNIVERERKQDNGSFIKVSIGEIALRKQVYDCYIVGLCSSVGMHVNKCMYKYNVQINTYVMICELRYEKEK